MVIKVKKLDPKAIIPTRGSLDAAGNDLYLLSDETVAIYPGGRKILRTGIAVSIPEGHFGAIYARSGLAIKKGIRPSNCVGVIDSDYRGEIMVGVMNDGPDIVYLEPGDRIAQMIIQEYKVAHFEESELDETERGEGGLGSTGRN